MVMVEVWVKVTGAVPKSRLAVLPVKAKFPPMLMPPPPVQLSVIAEPLVLSIVPPLMVNNLPEVNP